VARNSHTNKRYSEELKQQAVAAYLNGEGSQVTICKRFGVISQRQLHNWLVKANSGETEKSRQPKDSIYLVKGRRSTLDERCKIVGFCNEHNKDYALAASTFKVSYQQVYTWVRKFENGGENALVDRRGKPKKTQSK